MKVFIDTFLTDVEGCEEINNTWINLVGLNHGTALCKTDKGATWLIPCGVIRSFEDKSIEGTLKGMLRNNLKENNNEHI